jgi:hypothetical protein
VIGSGVIRRAFATIYDIGASWHPPGSRRRAHHPRTASEHPSRRPDVGAGENIRSPRFVAAPESTWGIACGA